MMTNDDLLSKIESQLKREAEILARIKQAVAILQEALDIIQGGKK